MAATIALEIPDPIYQRLINTANARGRSLEEMMLSGWQTLAGRKVGVDGASIAN